MYGTFSNCLRLEELYIEHIENVNHNFEDFQNYILKSNYTCYTKYIYLILHMYIC